jgi:hypothetical protein
MNTQPVPNPTNNPIILNADTTGDASSRPDSVLGSILVAHNVASGICTPSDFEPLVIAETFSAPRYTPNYLHRLNASRVGQAFHVLKDGKLARRGVVVSESDRGYLVYFTDAFGVLVKKQRVPKSETTHWQWFDGVQESNAAYARMFNIRTKPAPTPVFIWENRELVQQQAI